MAYEESLGSITLDADASIGIYTGVPGLPGSAASPNHGGKQYHIVKVTGKHAAGLATASTDSPVGVLQNKPQMVGAAATVAFTGISLVAAGAPVTAGAQVMAGTDGRAITLTGAGSIALGVAIEAATAAGQLIPVLIK